MITCLQAGVLPAIDRSPDATQMVSGRTLSEVVCTALYGMPLKPGCGRGSFREALQRLYREGIALWGNPNGPGLLRPHLERIADGKTWPYDPGTQDSNERITLNGFSGAQQWLLQDRKLSAARELTPELAEKARRLAEMTDAQAIAHALAEADRIERAESEVNAKAVAFYTLLSNAIVTQQIVLKAIATDPQTNVWLPRERGEPPHRTIAIDYFELPMVHDLLDNELGAVRASTEAEVLHVAFNRTERENEGLLVKWSEVKVPSEHVGWLLSNFRGERKATNIRPMVITSSPLHATTLNPNWLSLPGAIVWVVTRDKTLTRIADEQADNDRDIVLSISAQLAYEKAQNGAGHREHIEVADAWPALRRLIADEKIVAEGRSLERRGVDGAIETRYPNERIPSGDAAMLVIRGSVPGIEPKDALAPDEMYKSTNWQGRYWYDVRLRAADVFREFGSADEPRQPLKDTTVRQTVAAEAKCRKWLVAEMRAAPEGTDKSKIVWYREAATKFKGLGDPEQSEPSASFKRAWDDAIRETDAKWDRPGRKKSGSQNPGPK